MKAKHINILNLIEHNTNLVVGRKFNGYSEVMVISDGAVRVFNKSGTEQTDNVPHITGLHMPNHIDVVIPCEGITLGETAASAKSVFGSGPCHAIEWQHINGPATMVAVNITRFDGDDITGMPYGERLPLLSDTISELHSLGMDNIKQEILHHEHKMDIFNHIINDIGGEGVVVKDLLGLESAWFKVKKIHTWDMIIMGFTDAKYGVTGKYYGQIGAVIYGWYNGGVLEEVGKCSGMIDDVRIMFSMCRQQYIGKVIEIKGQELGSKGGIIHPRFVRIRDDKLPTDCRKEG